MISASKMIIQTLDPFPAVTAIVLSRLSSAGPCKRPPFSAVPADCCPSAAFRPSSAALTLFRVMAGKEAKIFKPFPKEPSPSSPQTPEILSGFPLLSYFSIRPVMPKCFGNPPAEPFHQAALPGGAVQRHRLTLLHIDILHLVLPHLGHT